MANWYLDQYIKEKYNARRAFIDKSKWEIYSEHLESCSKLLYRQVEEEFWYEDEYDPILDKNIQYLYVEVVDGFEQDNRMSDICSEVRRVWEMELSYYYDAFYDCVSELQLLIEYI